jgi:hypothetical protein
MTLLGRQLFAIMLAYAYAGQPIVHMVCARILYAKYAVLYEENVFVYFRTIVEESPWGHRRPTIIRSPG